MKVSIEGFNQEYALSLRKTVVNRDKDKLIKIDCTDLVILRWFVDFYPNMKKMVVDGREYAWLSHKKIMEDLPLVDISKRGFSERLQKLVEFKILTYKLIKESGTFTIYGFGENYINLVKGSTCGSSSIVEGSSSNDIGGSCSNSIGVVVQTATKDKTINNKTIKNNIKKESKKENKKTFDEIIENYTANEELQEELKNHLATRKAKKATLTNRAIELSLRKLDDLVQNEPVNEQESEKIKVVQQSIERGWVGFFALQDNKYNNNYKKANNDGWDYLNQEFKEIYRKKEAEKMPF